jgi:GT2 family glycosyltransferase
VQLSVVIPTLRRAATLRRCLDRLDGQAGGVLEVLVVDDPARDDADAVAAAVAGRARVVHTHAPGVSAQRNAGWRAARGDLVLFLGDDVLAEPGLVAAHLAAHEREPAEEVAALGHVTWARELRVTPFMRFLERGLQFDFGSIPGDDAGWGRFYAANASLKRALLERAGGFDESFAFGYEELELARRLRDLGLVVRYVPDARGEHLHEQTLAAYRERMATVAAAERAFVAKHPDVPPYFHDLFAEAVRSPASGRGARLASVVPERLPVLGPRVRASAEAAWRRELGEAFLAAWERA